jgi:hypothetical protein
MVGKRTSSRVLIDDVVDDTDTRSGVTRVRQLGLTTTDSHTGSDHQWKLNRNELQETLLGPISGDRLNVPDDFCFEPSRFAVGNSPTI